jgi:zinc protease
MMRKLWYCLFCLIVLSGCAAHSPVSSHGSKLPDGISWVETASPQDGNVLIPYSKYKLSNGLTVILSPDHSDPLVHVDVTYHVGSARERQGETGFAHFFEHMMFQGSKHVAAQQHVQLMTQAGGSLNGTTSRDRTSYYETTPANQLEKVLWLESDRMGFLLDALSPHKFEIQRSTVINERAQQYDNRPYGLVWEKMGEALFPPGHPYSWLTIGRVQDIERADIDDIKDFFLRWYGPNNAVLTIGGDIDIEQTLVWINKYFGPIPKGPEVDGLPKRPATLEQSRFLTLEDRIRQPMVVIGWPTAYQGADSEAPLNTLAGILGNGANGLLYQSLVKTQKAVNAGAFQDCGELACNFYIYALAPSNNKQSLQHLYHEILGILDRLSVQGVEPARLEQIKGVAKANAVFALESVRGKVTQLATNQTFFDQPERSQQALENITMVSPQSVETVLHRFIIEKPRVVLSVVPKGHQNMAVRTDNFSVPEPASVVRSRVKDSDLHERRVKDDFDRRVVPDVSGPVVPQIPKLYGHYFKNGIELMGTTATETPTVLVSISMPAGERYVSRGKEGLAALTAALMEEGTTLHTSEELQAELDQLGSSILFDTGEYTTRIVIACLRKNLDATLSILEEILFHPKFSAHDLKRIKSQMIQSTIFAHQKSTWLASQATRQVLFGDSVFARNSAGSEASIANLTLEDINSFYQRHYTPHGTQIAVVGDISERQAVTSLSFLSQWQGEAAPLLAPQVISSPKHAKIYLIDKPGLSQSIVRLVRRGLPFDATGELFLTQLAHFNLAGNFNSRMNQNLREGKGYTYGAQGFLSSNREVGVIVFKAAVRTDKTIETILQIRDEMKRFSRYGLTRKEMHFMRLAVGQQDALAYETPIQKASLISNMMTYSLDKDYLQQRSRIVADVERSVLNQIAKKWFNPADYQVIVVGDAKRLKPKLEKLDLPIAELEIIR